MILPPYNMWAVMSKRMNIRRMRIILSILSICGLKINVCVWRGELCDYSHQLIVGIDGVRLATLASVATLLVDRFN